MANTYTLIASNTLTGTAASVTFSSIPSTYSDLVLKISERNDNTGVGAGTLLISYNSDTTGATTYSFVRLTGNGSTASSALTANTYYNYSITEGSLWTTSTFSNSEIYIPNYNSTSSKPVSTFNVAENNATTGHISTVANLYRGTSAISGITLTAGGNNFVSGSSFFLYGISNS